MPWVRGDGSHLDAVPVEPGPFARWAHQGSEGLFILHRLHADGAFGAWLWSHLHILLWTVLRAVGAGGIGMGKVRNAGSFPRGGKQ